MARIIGTATCPLCEALGEEGDFCRANRLEGGDIFHGHCRQIYPAWLVNGYELLEEIRQVARRSAEVIGKETGWSFLTVTELRSKRTGDVFLQLEDESAGLEITIATMDPEELSGPCHDDSLRPISHIHQKVCNALLDGGFRLNWIAPATFSKDGLSVKVTKTPAP